MSEKKFKPSERRRARSLALQALYQWSMTQTDLNEIEVQFHTFNNMQKVDAAYFHQLVHDIPANLDSVDALFIPHLDRDLANLNPVELAILRIATYELAHSKDVPYRVIINEAVELTKIYGATDGHKYVNGIVDKVAHDVRAKEIGA